MNRLTYSTNKHPPANEFILKNLLSCFNAGLLISTNLANYTD